MRERDLIRTAESLADDLDAKLRAMPPRDAPTPSEWAEGFRDAVLAMTILGGLVFFCLSQGGF